MNVIIIYFLLITCCLRSTISIYSSSIQLQVKSMISTFLFPLRRSWACDRLNGNSGNVVIEVGQQHTWEDHLSDTTGRPPNREKIPRNESSFNHYSGDMLGFFGGVVSG